MVQVAGQNAEAQRSRATEEPSIGLTRELARFIAATDAAAVPSTAREHAKVALMDWIAVTMAGKDEPLVDTLSEYCESMGGHPQATVLGRNERRNVSQAALINGSASHALDYDDSLESFLGHPSVTLFPALLALAEWKGKSAREFLVAYVIGLQVGAAVGASAGMDHYMTGWHSTSTIGHLASAAACARLLGLDEGRTLHALGIAATQSAGLKRVFGTMCKPFHAGKASQAGLMAALLAEKGFTSAPDILEGPHGFFQCLRGKRNEAAMARLGRNWDVEDLCQKYHASCHATHSPLEGVLAVLSAQHLGVEDIVEIRLGVSQLALDAAGKTAPTTGLEGKFSIPYCVANAVIRGDTGNKAFTDEYIAEPRVRALMGKIIVTPTPEFKLLESRVVVEVGGGRSFAGYADVMKQIPPLREKAKRVWSKYVDLCEPVLGGTKTADIAERVRHLEECVNMAAFAARL
jgi:2-methylcitrate dehydratase PrpD